MRGTRETPGGQGEKWSEKGTTGGAYPALTRRKMIQKIKKWRNLNDKKGVICGSEDKKRLCKFKQCHIRFDCIHLMKK